MTMYRQCDNMDILAMLVNYGLIIPRSSSSSSIGTKSPFYKNGLFQRSLSPTSSEGEEHEEHEEYEEHEEEYINIITHNDEFSEEGEY